ncbi:MAG TPA: cellulose-binding domain-containing protein [Pseudonocardiaceae bacterium]|jgi:hypothetical protein|nr:cellulose-binding domain-containing protein [Pseudonocardiaceae bacterium]
MRRSLLAVLSAGICLAGIGIAVPTVPAATPPCQVTDQVDQWSGGFTSTITVTNGGPAVSGWTVTWTFDGDQHVTSAWNATVTQNGTAVTAANESYNGTLPTGGTVSFGFQATFSGTNDTPTDFAVNGQPCDGTPPPPTSTTTTTTTTTPPAGTGCTAASAVFCDGFEDQASATPSGRWSVDTPNCSGTGTAAVDPSTAHTGTKSLRTNGTDGYCNHVFVADPTDMATASPTWFVRFWIRHTTPLPTGHVTFLAMNDSANGNTDLRLGGQNGALVWNRQSDDATLPAQSPAGVAQSVPLPVNVWTCVEFAVDGGNGQIRTWVDGTAVPGLTEDGVPTPDVDAQWLGNANWRPHLTDLKLGWESYGGGGPDTLWFDDVALGTTRIGCA